MHCCSGMDLYIKEEIIEYSCAYREYGVPVLDGGSSYIVMQYCAWCGQKLPMSVREQWFEIFYENGWDEDEDSIPEEMHTDAWWRRLGL